MSVAISDISTTKHVAAKLEKAGLVKAVKAVKSPSQRIYVLTHIIPAADITGGNFFDAGEVLVQTNCPVDMLICSSARCDTRGRTVQSHHLPCTATELG